MICSLDTMILVWGLRDIGKSKEPAKEERAQLLLRLLEEEGAEIVVPTIVIAELLTPVPRGDHTNFLGEFRRRFRDAPFDLRAAALAADIRHTSLPRREQYSDKRQLRSDVLIVASAKAAGATVFYGHDKACRNLASRVMIAKDLPTHDERLPFSDDGCGRSFLSNLRPSAAQPVRAPFFTSPRGEVDADVVEGPVDVQHDGGVPAGPLADVDEFGGGVAALVDVVILAEGDGVLLAELVVAAEAGQVAVGVVDGTPADEVGLPGLALDGQRDVGRADVAAVGVKDAVVPGG